MGVVAPLSAVVGAGLPLLVGRAGRGAAGAGHAARGGRRAGGHRAGHRGHRPGRPAAGSDRCSGWPPASGSALFFIGLDATPPDSGLWPLVAGRVVTVAAARRAAAGPRASAARPTRLMIVSGVADTAANARVPAGHPARRPRGQRGRGVALPGGGRAAGPDRAAASGSPRCSSPAPGWPWGPACCSPGRLSPARSGPPGGQPELRLPHLRGDRQPGQDRPQPDEVGHHQARPTARPPAARSAAAPGGPPPGRGSRPSPARWPAPGTAPPGPCRRSTSAGPCWRTRAGCPAP